MPAPIPTMLASFLNYLRYEKRYSSYTISSYETDLVSFFNFLNIQYGSVNLREINHSYVRSWLAGLKEDKLTARTINRKISSLRSFFKYCLKTGSINESPMTKIVAPRNEKKVPQFVKEKEAEELLNRSTGYGRLEVIECSHAYFHFLLYRHALK
jgi:integrase/recombinase XerC